MAIFGDLGKALGLGSAKELLPTIGAAAGFYFGGPMGASIGSGIGSLAGGKSVNDALTNAALAYGVTSFVSPNMMSSSAKSSTGMFGPNALQNKLYGIEQVANPSTLVGNLNEGMTTGAVKRSGLGGLFDDFTMKDAFLASSLAGTALQALDKPEEGTPQRDPIGGTILGSVSSPTTDKVYDVTNPIEMAEYNEEISKFYDDDFKYEVEEPVRAAHGGAMYGHDKMGYDTPITGEVSGPGTGTSDSVPARLSDGEFVLTADAVRGAGGGDRDVGAARLYDMMSELEATA